MDKKKTTWIVIVMLILVGFTLYSTKDISTVKTTEPQVSSDFSKYLIEEPDFDYSDPQVMSIANQIKTTYSSDKDRIKGVLKYVASNIDYDSEVDLNYCYDEKASTVLKSGKGDCVSMSRLVTALLRAQGIPARTMGGCLSFKQRCDILFSTVYGLNPKVVEITGDDFKKRGYLHEWVEIWDGDRWVLGEATSGQVYPLDCSSYIEYGYDKDSRTRCAIYDAGFRTSCANG